MRLYYVVILQLSNDDYPTMQLFKNNLQWFLKLFKDQKNKTTMTDKILKKLFMLTVSIWISFEGKKS